MPDNISEQPYNPVISNITVWLVFSFSVIAITLNGLLAYLVLFKLKALRSLSSQLIVATTLVDIASGVNIVLMCLVRVMMGAPKVFELSWYCPIFGFGTIYFTGVCGILLSFLAMERYFLICLQRPLKPLIPRGIITICSIIFFIPSIMTSLNKGLIRDASYSYCVPGFTAWAKILNKLTGVVFVLPLIALTFFYVSIFTHCYRLNVSQALSVSRKMAVRAIIFLILYYICFFPKFLSSLWGLIAGRDSRPVFLYVLGPIGLALAMLINPILVLFLHRQIRKEALVFLFPGYRESSKKSIDLRDRPSQFTLLARGQYNLA